MQVFFSLDLCKSILIHSASFNFLKQILNSKNFILQATNNQEDISSPKWTGGNWKNAAEIPRKKGEKKRDVTIVTFDDI